MNSCEICYSIFLLCLCLIWTPKQVQKRGKTFTTATLLEIARRARNEGKRVCVYKPFDCLTLTDGGDRRLADVLWIFSLWMPVNTTFIYSVSELANLIHNNTKILYRFKSHGDIVRDMSRVREVSVRYGIEGTSRTYKDKETGEIKKTDRRHSYTMTSESLGVKEEVMSKSKLEHSLDILEKSQINGIVNFLDRWLAQLGDFTPKSDIDKMNHIRVRLAGTAVNTVFSEELIKATSSQLHKLLLSITGFNNIKFDQLLTYCYFKYKHTDLLIHYKHRVTEHLNSLSNLDYYLVDSIPYRFRDIVKSIYTATYCSNIAA